MLRRFQRSSLLHGRLEQVLVRKCLAQLTHRPAGADTLGKRVAPHRLSLSGNARVALAKGTIEGVGDGAPLRRLQTTLGQSIEEGNPTVAKKNVNAGLQRQVRQSPIHEVPELVLSKEAAQVVGCLLRRHQ